MEYLSEDVELVRLDWLKAHEETQEKKVSELYLMTLRWGGYTKPLLVDNESGTILDGHHRFEVGKKLQLQFLPAILTNYLSDDRITVTTWPNSKEKEINKEDVINMALSENLFPPKTSRHQISEYLPPIMIKLEDLK